MSAWLVLCEHQLLSITTQVFSEISDLLDAYYYICNSQPEHKTLKKMVGDQRAKFWVLI